MTATWTIWHRPNGSRRWHKLSEAATEAAAWDAIFDTMKRHGSGGWHACPSRKPGPTPRAKRPLKPANRTGAIRWD